jgi:NAD(P)-dependent dehydrogenase (short-subunit alcohol dehydrogenase family)
VAKASLNMMTRTSGKDFAQDNIYMNAVDTGWVTDERPLFHNIKFTAPIDEIDGAARVLDPVFFIFKFRFLHLLILENILIVSFIKITRLNYGNF